MKLLPLNTILPISLCMILSAYSNSAHSDDFVELKPQGTKTNPIRLDMAEGTEYEVTFDEETTYYVLFDNLLPTVGDNYILEFVEEHVSTRDALEKQFIDTKGDSYYTSNVDNLNCELDLNTFFEDLYLIKTEKELALQLADKVSGLQGSLAAPCKNSVKSWKEKYTQKKYQFPVKKGKQYKLSLSRGENASASLTAKPDRWEWIGHAGYLLVDNKDRAFISRRIESEMSTETSEIEEETTQEFEIIEVDSRKPYKGSAIGLYTLASKQSKNVKWGPTAGLAINDDDFSILLGGSVIIADNIVVTIGAVVSKFDVLESQYSTMNSIGSEPIDSSALTTESYKVTPGIVFSFRFGDEEE